MTSPEIPRNAYTHAPKQHPNLILGSLQLLFWLFFRPSAWRNHLARIDSALAPDSRGITGLRWRNPALWKLLLQGYLILPLLTYLLVNYLVLPLLIYLVLLRLGELNNDLLLTPGGLNNYFPLLPTLILLALSTISSIVLGAILSLILNINAGITLGTNLSVASSALVLFIYPFTTLTNVALSVVWGVALGQTWSMVSSIKRKAVLTVIFYFILSMLHSVAWDLLSGIGCWIGLTLNFWRPLLLYPFLLFWNFLLNVLEDLLEPGSTPLRWHSAFWDEWQFLPLPGLDRQIIRALERKPTQAKAAINYLKTSNQNWAVRSVRSKVDVRALERCTNLEAIRNVHTNLVTIEESDGLTSSIVREFASISKNVDAALNRESIYNQYLNLRDVDDRLKELLEKTLNDPQDTDYFFAVAKPWSKIITDSVSKLRQRAEIYQEIDNLYVIGVPLDHRQETFVKPVDITGTSISVRIEQLLLDRRRPPLLLYGQRRMGKTSLLKNLGRLLPNSIVPMFVDLQGTPTKATDNAGFFYNIVRDMTKSAQHQSTIVLPPLTKDALAADPFTTFDEWLDRVEETLYGKTVLLALDEFEALEHAIDKGRFDEEEIFATLRHLLQHRPRFKVLIAGSHSLEEFQRWASYLINVQVIHISYLAEPEARQLIERPVKDFTLRYETDASDRVLQLTRRHPFLIQLLCSEIVIYKNEQEPAVRRLATIADVEAAVPDALRSGAFFFGDIERNQINDPARQLLRYIASLGEGATASKKTIAQQFGTDAAPALELLLRRELIEPADDGYRFQVELIRRWFDGANKEIDSPRF